MMRFGLAFVGCCVVVAGCASADATSRHANAPASRDEKPNVLSVAYGRVRPQGASSAYFALSVRASDPDGQIVSWTYREIGGGGVGAVADGGCGLGGRRNGQVYDSPLPIEKLRAGTYRFAVTVEASTCTRHARPDRASRTFTIQIQ